MPPLFDRLQRSYLIRSLHRWFDSSVILDAFPPPQKPSQWRIPGKNYLALHLACFGVIWVGWSWTAIWMATGLYLVRMFAITGFYHRYFSHRTFETNRFWQFCFAVLGNSSSQRGPLWWASHHRHHHQYADTEADAHSPSRQGFWWSHIGWLTDTPNLYTRWEYVKDWAKFQELVWLDRFDKVVPILLGVALFVVGELLAHTSPQLGTNGAQLVIWGFFISTVVLFHGTCTINSLSHLFGSRRYNTPDTSRNNPLLALITLGEGWHNNHHHYAISARQGFFWWELDITYYLLVALSWIGIVRNLRPVPEHVRNPQVAQKTGSKAKGPPAQARG